MNPQGENFEIDFDCNPSNTNKSLFTLYSKSMHSLLDVIWLVEKGLDKILQNLVDKSGPEITPVTLLNN